MTHFTRPAVLAAALDPAEWDVFLWAPKRYHRLLAESHYTLGDLHTLDPALFLDSLAKGRRLYTTEMLRQYVQDDTRLFKEIRPDFIIGDWRLSLCISAPLNRVPFASIFNAYWSPFRKQPVIVPGISSTSWIPLQIQEPLYAVARPFIYAYHAKPVNDVRRFFGLPPLSNDLRAIYTAGDLTLYPDIPELVPVMPRPESHQFIGPCSWTPAIAKPSWWQKVMQDPAPKIFISMGSSGPVTVIPCLLEILSKMPVIVILTTSGRDIGKTAANVYTADLLPYEETVRHSTVVISHGGMGGIYPALAAATPMLAIPNNIDNLLSTAVLEESGAGLGIRAEKASAQNLRNAIERLRYEPAFKKRAEEWAVIMKGYDSKKIFSQTLRGWFSNRSISLNCM